MALELEDTVPNTDVNGNDNTAGIFGTGLSNMPHGCYWKGSTALLYFNPNGDRNDDDTERASICSKSAAMHLGCSI